MSALTTLSFKQAPCRPLLSGRSLPTSSDMPVKLVRLYCGFDERENLYISTHVHWHLPDQLSGLIKSTIAITSQDCTTRSTQPVETVTNHKKRVTAGSGDWEGRKCFNQYCYRTQRPWKMHRLTVLFELNLDDVIEKGLLSGLEK